MENPLLTDWKTPFALPPFDLISPSHFAGAVKQSVEKAKDEISIIRSNPGPPSFTNTIEALD
ncbi:MAG: hypothetical protein ACQETA_08990, partial [Bacteroidota bacterium]